jgi:hypothetical protein
MSYLICLLSGELIHQIHDHHILRLGAAARLEPLRSVRSPAQRKSQNRKSADTDMEDHIFPWMSQRLEGPIEVFGGPLELLLW